MIEVTDVWSDEYDFVHRYQYRAIEINSGGCETSGDFAEVFAKGDRIDARVHSEDGKGRDGNINIPESKSLLTSASAFNNCADWQMFDSTGWQSCGDWEYWRDSRNGFAGLIGRRRCAAVLLGVGG